MFELMPQWFWLFVAGSLGLVIGSFLNVVIYRLHTGKSLNGHSHCLSCGKALSWYELVPVLSYVLLRGRCRNCGAYIPVRYLLVELLTAFSFVLVILHTKLPIEIFWLWLVLSVLIIVAIYDLSHLIIPDELAVVLGGLGFLWAFYQNQQDLGSFGLTLAASFLGAATLAGLWFVSGGRWLGLGDAKLFVGLGFLVGAGGVFSLLVLSFWVGALLALALIIIQWLLAKKWMWGRVKMKSEVPFAPFLIIAWFLVFFAGANVLNYTAHVTEFLYSLL